MKTIARLLRHRCSLPDPGMARHECWCGQKWVAPAMVVEPRKLSMVWERAS